MGELNLFKYRKKEENEMGTIRRETSHTVTSDSWPHEKEVKGWVYYHYCDRCGSWDVNKTFLEIFLLICRIFLGSILILVGALLIPIGIPISIVGMVLVIGFPRSKISLVCTKCGAEWREDLDTLHNPQGKNLKDVPAGKDGPTYPFKDVW